MNADKLAKALEELPAAYHQLHLFRLPGSRPPDINEGKRQGKSPTQSTRSPLVLSVVDLLDRRHKADVEPTRDNYELDRLVGSRRLGILPTLSQWVRLVDGELWDSGVEHRGPDDSPTVEGECAWLSSHIDWITEQSWADEITDDVTKMLRDCQLITGTGTELIKLTCTKLGCGWPVHEQDGGNWYKCSGCGNAWGRLELHRMAERKQPKSLAECAKLAGVSEKTLQRYKAQGVFQKVRMQGKTELFDLDEVMKATMNLRYRETSA